ncbi:NAD(P)H-dependent oxidoreductase [Flavobacterium degerlachei]|uniref:NAD(P)H-dependent FMN reductase n=1 Tax=Flavobacterium degerlachei TaxID=229203 RepID=A0A1H3E978_9FLAO|nr:NAD(P)H-dependent oxidoreductase [Flavobacterium degerlachei]SDX75312.1 NAD(P)H-dependent FMN reductase [Flavobacterium degerlachei]
MKKIIAFTGSNNPNSINEKLVQSIIRKYPNQNIEFIDLKRFDVPIYSQDIEQNGIPKPIKKLFQLFTEADAFIIASPEHNGLPSAFLKNTIDWLSRINQKFIDGKPVLLLSTSPGPTGGKTHLQILEKLVLQWGGLFVEQYSLGSFDQNFDKSGLVITNQQENIKLKKAMQALIIGQPLTKKQNVEVVQDYFNSFQNGNMEQVINSFHSDCYIVSVKEEERPKEQLHGIYRTKDGAKQFLNNITSLFNTKDFTLKHISSAGDNLVMANGTFSHEIKATGKLFNSTWVQLCIIEDEKIKEYRFYEDSAAFIAASTL